MPNRQATSHECDGSRGAPPPRVGGRDEQLRLVAGPLAAPRRRRAPAARSRPPLSTGRLWMRSTRTRVVSRAMATADIFKAYDVRGIYGEQIDGDIAEQIGRGFARVIGDLSGKDVGDLRLGLGRDMRLTAPELAERYKAGMVSEGAHVLDAGMVGTEMLYFLVGSRDLDGGLMCTASHNPKQYTGAKMVEKGALALSGDRGLQDIRKLIDDGPARGARAAARARTSTSPPSSARPRSSSSTPARSSRMKVVVDGGNGMAGADGRPDPRAVRPRPRDAALGAGRRVPRRRAQPAAAREPPHRHRRGHRRAAPTSASPGTATPTAASSSTTRAASSTATSSPRCSPSRCSRSSPAPRSSTTSAPRAPSPTSSRRPAAPRTSTASATPSSRPACATRAASSAARSPATTTSPSSTTRTRGRSPRC